MQKVRRMILSALYALGIAGCGQSESVQYEATRPVTFPQPKVLHCFKQRSGCIAFCDLTHNNPSLFGTIHCGGVFDAGVSYRDDLTTNAYEVILSFGDFDGRQPFSDLTIHDGTVYGVTEFGGLDDRGTIFAWSPVSGLKTRHHFSAAKYSAAGPHAGPIFHARNLFGTTFHGGSRNGGIIYRFGLLDQQFDPIAELTEESGQFPICHPVLLKASEVSERYSDSLLLTCCDLGQAKRNQYGSLIRASLDTGENEVLHRFRGGRRGGHPYDVPLHVDNGDLVGTAMGRFGDPADTGVVYEFDLRNAKFKVLQTFHEAAGFGINPNGSLAPVGTTRQRVSVTHRHQANARLAGGLFLFDTEYARLTSQSIFQDPKQRLMPTRTPIVIKSTNYGTCCFDG